MKKWQDNWPFLGAVLLFGASVDWFIIPYLLSEFSSIWTVFFIATPLANTEVRLWYEFWRWFIKEWLPTSGKIKEGMRVAEEVERELRKRGIVEIIQETKEELKRKGILEFIVDQMHGTFKKATNPDNRLWKIAKALSHLGMFILGAEPFFPLGRVVAVIFCATTNFKKGLYSLYVGNAVHVFLVILQWKAGISLWNYIFN